MGYSPWGCKDLDVSEHTHITKFVYYIYTYIYTHIFFFRFFSYIGYYRILSRVPCTISKSLLIIYLRHNSRYLLIPSS